LNGGGGGIPFKKAGASPYTASRFEPTSEAKLLASFLAIKQSLILKKLVIFPR
jgi:hypothetical protein